MADSEKKMTERERKLEQAVAAAYWDAKSYVEEIEQERADSTDYYNGAPFGDEEEGRSQVISRDVRDTVQSFMPSIMRVLFGSERPVELEPRGIEDVEAAAQATDYLADVVLQQDNDGFLAIHAAVKDALVRKLGVLKWWWDDRVRLEASEASGLSAEDVLLLEQDDTIEEIKVEQTSPEGIEPKVFAVTVQRRIGKDKGRARFAAVPTEEFLIDRRARSIRDAAFVAHRAMVTVSDLVAMGYDRETVLEQSEMASKELDTATTQARNPHEFTFGGGDGTSNEDMRRVLYVEAYVRYRLSEDEDDPAQLVKVCGTASGKSFQLLDHEAVDEIPFAILCPDPEPHTIFGLCPADVVKDLQRIKSAILRGTLDSLALSIHPRYEAVENQVNLQDLMNSEVGGIVRTKTPGMLREISLPFVGDKTLPMLDYLDRVKESRTKQSQASQGLDADALQSSTKAAVSATISAAQAQIELVTRIFAETGIRDLFRGLYRLIVRHQDKARTVRLRGKWVNVDPKAWDAEMDVRVNVALGAGSVEEKLASLGAIALKQEQVLMAAPGNPMVSFHEYRNTVAKMAELAGWRDASKFFKEVPEDYQPPQPPSQDGGDAKALAEAQMADIQAKVQIEQAKLALAREQMTMDDKRERDKMVLEAQVRIAIEDAKTKGAIDEKRMDALIEKMRAQQDHETAVATAKVAASARPTTGGE